MVGRGVESSEPALARGTHGRQRVPEDGAERGKLGQRRGREGKRRGAGFPRGGDRGREVLDVAAGRGLKAAGAGGGSGPAPRPIGFPGRLGQAPPPATASRTPCLPEPCGRRLTSG